MKFSVFTYVLIYLVCLGLIAYFSRCAINNNKIIKVKAKKDLFFPIIFFNLLVIAFPFSTDTPLIEVIACCLLYLVLLAMLSVKRGIGPAGIQLFVKFIPFAETTELKLYFGYNRTLVFEFKHNQKIQQLLFKEKYVLKLLNLLDRDKTLSIDNKILSNLKSGLYKNLKP